MPSPKDIALDFSEIVEAMDQPIIDTALYQILSSKFSRK